MIAARRISNKEIVPWGDNSASASCAPNEFDCTNRIKAESMSVC